MNRFVKTAIPTVLLLGLAACKAKTAAVKPPEKPVKVERVAATEAVAQRTLSLTGSLRGEKESDLAANANGRVVQTFAERGDEVKAGALLARLDTRAAALSAQEAKLSVESASQQALRAKQECDRARELYTKGGISKQELEGIESNCTTSTLAVSAASTRSLLAAQNVGDGIIRAPFAGLIGERYIEPGEYVRSDTRVVSLVSIDPLRLEFAVPEAYLTSVKTGGSVSFTVAAHKDVAFTGKIKFVGARIRPETRDVVVEGEISNKERKLLPGMFASVILPVGEEPAASIPKAATVERDGRSFVFAIKDTHLEERVVQLAPNALESAIVKSGLKPGEFVATGDISKLRNGQAVE